MLSLVLALAVSTQAPSPSATLTLDEAVALARQAAEANDGPAALEIEAERRADALQFDDVRIGLEHRAVQRFIAPEINNNTNQPYSAGDEIALSATVPVPRLDDVVRTSAADLKAAAARAELKQNSRDLASDVRDLVVDISALKRERALLGQALVIAQEREALLAARRASGTATIIDVDDAGRERLAIAADAVGIDDDLHKARDDLSLLIDADNDVDDDLEARCQQPLPGDDDTLRLALSVDPRQQRLRLLDEALARDELAGWLGYLPWPNRLQATWINRDPGRPDDVRLGFDVNVPLFKILQDDDDASALRRQANSRERSVLDARAARKVQQAQLAVAERRKMVGLLALPPAGESPDDRAVVAELELHRNLAERRRLRAIARCARAVVDVLSLVSD